MAHPEAAPHSLGFPSAPVAPAPQAPFGPPIFPKPLLEIRELTARIDERTVLKRLSLQIGARGVYTLLGPGGGGKSSLLGILSGRNRAGSGWTLEGEIFYQGTVLGSAARPSVIEQRLAHPAVRLRDYLLGELDDGVADAYEPEQLVERLREQLGRVHLAELGEHLDEVLGHGELRLSQGQWRRLAIARELITDPPLLCVDEPTAGLPDAEAALVVSALQAERQLRAVLMVTHHQQQARDCSDYVILLAGGCVHEYQPTAAFFAQPQSEAARAFVRTGGCAVPSPDAQAEQLETAAPDPLPEPASAPPAVAPAQVRAVSAALPLPAAPPPQGPAPAPPSSAPASAPDSLALRLRDFGLQLGDRVLLAGINLEVAARGVHLLVTSAATDKRLLLRALCGPRPSTFNLLGEALYKGRPLTGSDDPVTPILDARLALMPAAEYLASSLPVRGSAPSSASAERAALAMLEQAGWPELGARLQVPMCDLEPYERRVVELLGTAATAPALLILDEPLAGVGADELPRLLLLLRHQAAQRALLLLVHDAGPLPLYDWPVPARVMWLHDGRVQDSAPAVPDAIEPLPASPAVPTPPPAPYRPAGKGPASSFTGFTAEQTPRPSRGSGPRGFHWLRPGALAGMPAPGLTNDLDYDLGLIRAAGVCCLVTLTGEPLPAAALREHELASLFFPIPDMEAPAFEAAAELAQQVAGLLAQGLSVGFHCKAGLGRTGTMLAMQLVWEGAEASAALVQVRHVEPGWVQSEKQEQFLFGFQDWLQQRRLWRPAGP